MSRKCSESLSPLRIYPRLSSSPLLEASVIIHYQYAPAKSDSCLFLGFVFFIISRKQATQWFKISASNYSNTKQLKLSCRILSHNNRKGWFDSSWWECCHCHLSTSNFIVQIFARQPKFPWTNWNFEDTEPWWKIRGITFNVWWNK